MTRHFSVRLWLSHPTHLLCILWLPPRRMKIQRDHNRPNRTICERLTWRRVRIRRTCSIWPEATKDWHLYYADRGDYARALQVLHRWRDAVPNDPQVDAEEGLILLKSGRWQEAEPLLTQAFAARPHDENVLNALGLLAWDYKRHLDEAVELFTSALAIHTAKDNFQASLHNNLGGVYGDLQQFPSAVEQFESAIAISPDDAEYHTNLAAALAEMNRYQEAAVEVNIALRIAPDYPPARAVLQRLQHR